MKTLIIALLFLTTYCFAQSPDSTNPDDLYLEFVESYAQFNSEGVANLYVSDATLLNLYDSETPNSVRGQGAIKKHFSTFFSDFIRKKQKLLLTFKLIDRKINDKLILDNGVYRLEIMSENLPKSTHFGKFSTVLELVDNKWRFKTDASTNTNFEEFDNAIGKFMPQRDEILYPEYYDTFLGDYQSDENQLIVIGRSQSRLYAYFENNQQYRGLKKQNTSTWTAGNTAISDSVVQKIVFKSNFLEIYEKEKLITKAFKKDFYKTEKVFYPNKSGISLGATLFIPNKPSTKAIVLVHGSGGQDRNGYASIIRLLADVLARNGMTVLTYDKQGVGGSSGDWEKQNFTQLAQDALSGIGYLKNRKDLTIDKIGLGGSSQAGWIIAKAIEQSKDVDFTMLIGAAGSGIPVTEQNLYNTKVQMECIQQFNVQQIEITLLQQQYFFDYVNNRSHGKTLDSLTEIAAQDTLIRDWLFPSTLQIDFINRNRWFTALEIGFNPLSVWANYKNPVLMIFSQFDDSTPTNTVVSKLKQLNKKNLKTVIIPNAQHIGLETDSVCKGDISTLQRFNPLFFTEIKNWLSKL